MSLLCPIFRYLLLVKWTFYQLAINIFIGCILHFPSWWPDRESVPHKHIREASWLQDKDYQPRKVQVIIFGPGLWFQEINTKHFPNLNSRVRPSTGSISPGQSVTVEIHVSGQKEASSKFSKIVDITFDQVASLSRDKFLVTAVLLDREDIPASQLADALRTQTPDGQYRSICWSWWSAQCSNNVVFRLRCNLAGAPETGSGIGPIYASPLPAGAASPEDPARQVWEGTN